MYLTQTKPRKDSVIILTCKDIIPARPPDIHPDLISHRQSDHTAFTGLLATFVRKGGVIQRHYFLSILENSTLSTPIHRDMHGEVIEAIHRAAVRCL